MYCVAPISFFQVPFSHHPFPSSPHCSYVVSAAHFSWLEAAAMDWLDASLTLQDHTIPIPSDAGVLQDLVGQSPNFYQASWMDLGEEPVKVGAAGEAASDDGHHSSNCLSGYKKIGWGKASDDRVGPPREFRAVEMALRNSPGRATFHIFELVISTPFDSLGEAYEFYNLYSWEVGFGIRYGTSYSNAKVTVLPRN